MEGRAHRGQSRYSLGPNLWERGRNLVVELEEIPFKSSGDCQDALILEASLLEGTCSCTLNLVWRLEGWGMRLAVTLTMVVSMSSLARQVLQPLAPRKNSVYR